MSNTLDSRRFPLNKEQYKLWEQFVTDNYETIYSNKDTHEVRHTPHSPKYTVTVEMGQLAHSPDSKELAMILKIL